MLATLSIESFHESGSWILQDGIYSYADFLDEFGEPRIITKLSQHSDGSLRIHLHCDLYGEWAQLWSSSSKTDGGPRKSTFKLPSAIDLQLNPPDSSSGVPGAANFLEFLENRLEASILDVLDGMEPSRLVGNLRFDKPKVYIFPASQGNCSLFGIRGFTMLIDGGYTRYPCSWKFVRHIERLDSMLITRIDENNCLSLLSLLRSEKTRSVLQRVGNVFANLGDDNEISGMKYEKSIVDDRDVPDDLSVNIMQVGKHIRRNLLSQNVQFISDDGSQIYC
ncbi:electromotor neuron-associated protein 1-like [Brevipalpus obovatus]|uniref:electromotor neuron-associated protein 1-like n=1 Tax=Brevipalpus obovatus TaxID=246614 RepID=UPI003D9E001D